MGRRRRSLTDEGNMKGVRSVRKITLKIVLMCLTALVTYVASVYLTAVNHIQVDDQPPVYRLD